MNLLQLATELAEETGTNAGLTVTGATGEWKRLINWCRRAWIDIQREFPEAEWMRNNVVFDTVANQGEYPHSTTVFSTPATTGLADFGHWRQKSFRIYLKSAGVGTEWLLGYKDYSAFRDFYLLSSRKLTYARPTEITISPSKSLILGLAPNDIYTVSGEYYTIPQQLLLDADAPSVKFPEDFHYAIVYRAMMKYGAYESASEVYGQGERELKSMMNKIRIDQLPKMQRGASLI
jgi:hypothetical protein